MIKRWRLYPPELNYNPKKPRGARWRYGSWRRSERHTLRLLRSIEARQNELVEEPVRSGKEFWLLPFRNELRNAFHGVDYRCHEGQLEILRYYLATCPRPMIAICLSLIARCTDRFRLYELKQFCNDPSPAIRKHVAKALRRLEAWTLLDEMAAAHPGNEAIQWFANAPTTRRPYAQRLARFKQSVDDSHADEAVGPSRMSYWSLYTPWQGRPAKSLALIRDILLRIRQWVHGN